MDNLTEFEWYLLEMVAKGKGKEKWNWHDIAILVIPQGIEGEGNMMETLKSLEQRGLVKRYVQPGKPMDKWELTENGENFLNTRE